jgi:hypothetical protein
MAMSNQTMKQLTEMINTIMGQKVLTERQLAQIMQGAKHAKERGGMEAVLEYLIHVTQADVSKEELQQFADVVQQNPQMGMDILKGRKNIKKRR